MQKKSRATYPGHELDHEKDDKPPDTFGDFLGGFTCEFTSEIACFGNKNTEAHAGGRGVAILNPKGLIQKGLKKGIQEGTEEAAERSVKETAKRAARPRDRVTMGADEALDRAQSYLGEGYDEIADGVFRSADGTRQVRMTPSDLDGSGNHAGAPHLNFEEGRTEVTPGGRRSFRRTPNGNSHVFIEPKDL